MAFENISNKISAYVPISKNSLLTLLFRVLAVVVNLLFNLFIARQLPPSEAGVFFIILTFITLCSQLSSAGLCNITLRFMSADYASKKIDSFNECFSFGFIITMVISSLLSIVFFIKSSFFSELLNISDYVSTFRVAIFTIIPFSLMFLFVSGNQSISKSGKGMFFLGLLQPIIFFLVMIFFDNNLLGMICALLVSHIANITFVVISWLYEKKTKIVFFDLNTFNRIKTCWFSFFISILLPQLKTHSPTLIASDFLNKDAIAGLNICIKISAVMIFILGVVNIIVAPKLAAYYSNGELNKIELLLKKSIKLNLALCLPIFIIITLFTSQILSFFGSAYVSFSYVLIILMIGQVINVATGSVGQLLLMSGMSKLYNYAMIISIAVLLLGIVLFVPTYGVLALSIMISISIAIQNILFLIFSSYYLRVRLW